MTKNQARKLCIYHGNCPDGFGAAWAVRNALGESVDFYKGMHQQTPPDVQGLHVILVDFSYKKDVLEKMLQQAASITILDHHISAEQDLSSLLTEGRIAGVFDMNQSGAMLAWQWFNPQQQVPRLIEHIQDRDLWQFKLDGTNEIMAALSSYAFDFESWDKLMACNEDELHTLKQEGKSILRKTHKDIKELMLSGVRRMMIGGYNVPVLNVPPVYVSDAGNIMSVDEPFAACYWDHATGRSFSLRSSDNGVDVSEVAKHYGGGGHVKAAGFTVPVGWEGEQKINIKN
ncbi:MAG: DHHA1 domain-containing protein [Gammaproteobacteria bacterium]|nr:DHHA1 domain-containing protein [Gammaproteobacteria bacterium]